MAKLCSHQGSTNHIICEIKEQNAAAIVLQHDPIHFLEQFESDYILFEVEYISTDVKHKQEQKHKLYLKVMCSRSFVLWSTF